MTFRGTLVEIWSPDTDELSKLSRYKDDWAILECPRVHSHLFTPTFKNALSSMYVRYLNEIMLMDDADAAKVEAGS